MPLKPHVLAIAFASGRAFGVAADPATRSFATSSSTSGWTLMCPASSPRAICARRFSFSTSSSASGLRRSMPETKSPRNPRKMFASRLNMIGEVYRFGAGVVVKAGEHRFEGEAEVDVLQRPGGGARHERHHEKRRSAVDFLWQRAGTNGRFPVHRSGHLSGERSAPALPLSSCDLLCRRRGTRLAAREMPAPVRLEQRNDRRAVQTHETFRSRLREVFVSDLEHQYGCRVL